MKLVKRNIEIADIVDKNMKYVKSTWTVKILTMLER